MSIAAMTFPAFTITAEELKKQRRFIYTWYGLEGSSVIYTKEVGYGEDAPEFMGELPTKPSDSEYNYTFDHWGESINIDGLNETHRFDPVFKATAIDWVVWRKYSTVKVVDTTTYTWEKYETVQRWTQGSRQNEALGFTSGNSYMMASNYTLDKYGKPSLSGSITYFSPYSSSVGGTEVAEQVRRIIATYPYYLYTYSTRIDLYQCTGRVIESDSRPYAGADAYIWSFTAKSSTEMTGTVSSTNRNAYPDNGSQGGVTYKYLSESSTYQYEKGETYIEDVHDHDPKAYPDGGAKQAADGTWYWYEKAGIGYTYSRYHYTERQDIAYQWKKCETSFTLKSQYTHTSDNVISDGCKAIEFHCPVPFATKEPIPCVRNGVRGFILQPDSWHAALSMNTQEYWSENIYTCIYLETVTGAWGSSNVRRPALSSGYNTLSVSIPNGVSGTKGFDNQDVFVKEYSSLGGEYSDFRSEGYTRGAGRQYHYTIDQDSPLKKGTFIENVQSKSKDTYPEEGSQGDYWYSYDQDIIGDLIREMGELVDTVIRLASENLPEDGIADDGYWYVKQ